jgi:pyruvate formate lyase activating enzyme
MKEAKLYKKDGLNVRCLACAHRCLISQDKTGICGVRQNIEGKLYLLVYGKIVAKHIDPIEKKPFKNFLPGTYAFSIGTIGCNFKCNFCQNYDISQFKEFYGDKILGENILPRQIVTQAIRAKCKSIAYTYNEPTIFIEFVKDVARIAKRKDLKNILVTNGYLSSESFNFIKNYIDAMNIDLKSFREEFYNHFCGASLKPVLETIKKAHKEGIHIEITTLIIPKENDSLEELEEIPKFISSISDEIPWHVTRYFPQYKLERPVTPIETLKQACEIGKKYLKYVYMGNV